MTHYSTTIDTFVAGIPCQLGVVAFDYFSDVEGSYVECEFHVLDRRGRRAAWLERKITSKMNSDLIAEIEHYLMADAADEYFGD
jgi:hypothetical protein